MKALTLKLEENLGCYGRKENLMSQINKKKRKEKEGRKAGRTNKLFLNSQTEEEGRDWTIIIQFRQEDLNSK